MSRGSASHVAVNHPPSPSQRPPAQSDLRRLKASQICSRPQGRSRFHKRLCQNDAGVRCLSIISMMSSPWTQWPTGGRLKYLATCRPVEISTRFRIPNLIELISTIVKWKNQNSQLQSYRTHLHFKSFVQLKYMMVQFSSFQQTEYLWRFLFFCMFTKVMP